METNIAPLFPDEIILSEVRLMAKPWDDLIITRVLFDDEPIGRVEIDRSGVCHAAVHANGALVDSPNTFDRFVDAVSWVLDTTDVEV